MVTEDYVSFETAKLLKEKGFDEECKRRYNCRGELSRVDSMVYMNSHRDMQDKYVAPTLQMAMKWLREVYCLFIDIEPLTGITYAWSIWLMNESKKGESSLVYNTYEQACESAIKYCLEHLI